MLRCHLDARSHTSCNSTLGRCREKLLPVKVGTRPAKQEILVWQRARLGWTVACSIWWWHRVSSPLPPWKFKRVSNQLSLAFCLVYLSCSAGCGPPRWLLCIATQSHGGEAALPVKVGTRPARQESLVSQRARLGWTLAYSIWRWHRVSHPLSPLEI